MLFSLLIIFFAPFLKRSFDLDVRVYRGRSDKILELFLEGRDPTFLHFHFLLILISDKTII